MPGQHPQSHLQIHIYDFGGDKPIPMAYPPEVTITQLIDVARTMLDEGKVRKACVVNTAQPSAPALWWGAWEMRTGTSGGTSMS